jgi:hypothetical protein
VAPHHGCNERGLAGKHGTHYDFETHSAVLYAFPERRRTKSVFPERLCFERIMSSLAPGDIQTGGALYGGAVRVRRGRRVRADGGGGRARGGRGRVRGDGRHR